MNNRLTAWLDRKAAGERRGTFLALDLATVTGYAIVRDGVIISGVKSFKTKRTDGRGLRYMRFSQWLGDVFKQCDGKIAGVYFEDVARHNGTAAAHVYGGFVAHLTAWCEHHRIPYTGLPVGTIKRYITGKGNASKGDVIAAVQRLGHTPEDDNEADALAILYCGLGI